MQEKYPQPKPEVFSRKDVMENQVNVNSSHTQVLLLTARLAWERTALVHYVGIYAVCSTGIKLAVWHKTTAVSP